jgi:hypothetical protein
MEHEDGYCDRCGAVLSAGASQVTLDGDEVCADCVEQGRVVGLTLPKGAYDRG